MLKLRKAFLFLAVLTAGFSPAAAYAYIDPGTGSYLLQILIAAVLGGLFAIKIFWGNIKSFFRGLFTGKGGDRPRAENPDG